MKIIQEFIKEGSINRPKAKNSCTFITVHETANEKKGADAAAHAKYIKTLRERTSWHYTVDDKSIYQHLPDNEKSYHTSSSNANENSIAIELCVNSDGDFEKTKENAVWLIRELMEKYNIPKQNILSHRDWTGKTCPEKLLKNGWDAFMKKCASEQAHRCYILVVMKSQNMDSRITMLGEVNDEAGKPVLAVLELQPTNKGGQLLNMNIVASAYGKNTNLANFIQKSELLYLDPNIKRTTTWLNAVGLQLPSVAFPHNGSIGNITYSNGNVKVKGVSYTDIII